MSEAAEIRIQRACDAIVGYLALYPAAADNEHGIAQWWLPEMGVNESPAVVRLALESLLQRQVVACACLPDGSVIYRAAAGGRNGRA